MRTVKPIFFSVSIAFALCSLLVLSAVAFANDTEQVIQITAKRFSYTPSEIKVKKGVPVVLEFTSLDRLHGFSCPGLNIRTDVPPKTVTRLRFTPDKAGSFPFHCDNFCGTGHEGMTGTITVEE